MPYVTEPLPLAALDASIVLHVRAHWRNAIDASQSECNPDQLREGLALLFGVDSSLLSSIDPSKIATQRDRIALAAGVIARQTGKAAVPLGHDAAFVQRCTRWLAQRVRSEPALKEIFADDPATLLVLSEAIDLAATKSPAKRTPVSVLLCGETGTGKELLARAIHHMSLERKAIQRDCYIPVHVAGLSSDFVNDELFGHVKGAFTDARENREGQIQAADRGTLLIDEVGDLSRDAQMRLLRVVQDGLVTRTGENTPHPVAVRILAATNRDLGAAVVAGSFRRDLLYRLAQGSLELPPLRARAGWTSQIVDQILRKHGQAAAPLIVRSARDALGCHQWLGNLRELDSVLEIAVANANGTPVRVEHLPRYLHAKYLQAPLEVRAAGDLCDDVDPDSPDPEVLEPRLADLGDRISHVATPVAQDAHLSGITAFYERIPDRSPEHAQALQALRELSRVTYQRDKLVVARNLWLSVARRGLPPSVAKGVAAETTRASTDVDKKAAGVAAVAATIDIAKDPWWKLATDLGDLPFLDPTAKPAIQQFIPLAMALIATLSRDAADEAVAVVRRGGLPGVIAAVTQALREANESAPQSSFDIEHAGRAQWLAWRDEFPKKRDLVAACGRDAKTVAKYSKKACRGVDPWTQAPPGKRSKK
jgi:DNA-binding NtrC family response regulator